MSITQTSSTSGKWVWFSDRWNHNKIDKMTVISWGARWKYKVDVRPFMVWHPPCTLIIFFFKWLAVIIVCEVKIILWHQRNKNQWKDCPIITFVWVILYSTIIFQLLLLVLERKRCIYTLFSPGFSFSFLRWYWLVETNQLESWVYL